MSTTAIFTLIGILAMAVIFWLVIYSSRRGGGRGRMKRLLFVCVENSGRSQIAEAFARIYSGDEIWLTALGLVRQDSSMPEQSNSCGKLAMTSEITNLNRSRMLNHGTAYGSQRSHDSTCAKVYPDSLSTYSAASNNGFELSDVSALP